MSWKLLDDDINVAGWIHQAELTQSSPTRHAPREHLLYMVCWIINGERKKVTEKEWERAVFPFPNRISFLRTSPSILMTLPQIGKVVTEFVLVILSTNMCFQCPTPLSDFKSQELDICGWHGMRELVFTSVKIHRALVSRHNHRGQVPGHVCKDNKDVSLFVQKCALHHLV